MRDQSDGRINSSAAAAFATVCERKLNIVSVLGAPKHLLGGIQWGSVMRSSFQIRQGLASEKFHRPPRVAHGIRCGRPTKHHKILRIRLRPGGIIRRMTEPALTRRRSDNPHQETWHIYFTDVRVGAIGARAGVPITAGQWGWSCGFYPGLHPGQHRNGTAATFEAAREPFEAAWSDLQPNIPNAAFAEWRDDRDWRAELAAKRARGEKLDSEIRSTLMRCVCGTTFDSWKPAESYPHRQHIYAAQATNGTYR